jgi:2-polyprenyl-3-methyl-5-hydroxy-6-metoxy-1,4-benzoquinol methylase
MISGCPFCHHESFRVYRKNQLTKDCRYKDIVICNECGLLYPIQRMGLDEIQKYIKKMNTNSGSYSFGDPVSVSEAEIKRWRFLTGFVRSGGNALDIGTFDGSFCHSLKLLGFSAYGLEPQIEAVNHALKYGLNVYQGAFPNDIPDELDKKKNYSLISLMEVIYYFRDLRSSLKMINELLADDGFLLIKCHQGYSRYYDDNSYFSRYGDHVQGIPSLASLKYCLGKAGFEIVIISGECSPDLLPPVLRLSRSQLLKRGVTKLYQLFMLNWTLWDINRADRLIILAKKIE